MRRRIYILGIVIIFLLLAVGSCRKAGTWLVKEAGTPHADVMVMLTGRIPDRVLQVDDLYREQVAAKVWIVQEHKGANTELEKRGVELIIGSALARNILVELGIPADSILILPGNASSTQLEAEQVRTYLSLHPEVDSLLLVTSSSHSRRAYMIFKAALKPMEDPPVLFCSPSTYTGFHAEKWWKSREDIQSVVFEYVKMTGFLLFEKRKLKRQE